MSTSNENIEPNVSEQIRSETKFDLINAATVAFKELQKAILNERFSPNVLQYQEEVITALQGWVEEQRTVKKDMVENADKQIYCDWIETEVLRVTYAIRQYLRMRLQKIESHCMYILSQVELHDKLSSFEKEFVRNYFKAFDGHLKKQVLKFFPKEYQSSVRQLSSDSDSTRDMVCPPKTYIQVIVQAVDNNAGWIEADKNRGDVELSQDSIHYVCYDNITKLLDEGKVRLI
eukprot:TRINITY_DN27065_c0_g1_i2.p1 TRINITY_DN27065_c0_g1~~TRINITY_DN27065_c0_g1_i2.p1  ORF type:complete len:232 (+),score=10.41 TRINITY_DN27065_c0_g1_i2:86-781(+)